MVTVLLVGVGWASPASAGSINVNCSSQSLQTKINAAPSGATLNVKGTCRGPFKIKKSITLRGAPTATLDGQDLGTTLTITGTPTVHLTRLVITRGLNSAGSYSAGGGILHAGGALSLRSVTVLDNAAVGVDAAGGGIYSSGGSLRLVSASVVQNRADAASAGPGITSADAGGIYSAGPLTLIHSTVSSNHATAVSTAPNALGNEASAFGGGIDDESAARFGIRSSHIDGNHVTASATSSAFASGGGIAGETGGTRITMTGSTARGNSARGSSSNINGQGLGGAMFIEIDPGKLSISKSAITGNVVSGGGTEASALGGGVYVISASTVLQGVHLAGNHASASASSSQALGEAGGLFDGAGTLTISSSSISRNGLKVAGVGTHSFAFGGAIYDAAGDPFAVSKSTFDRNHVTAGATGADIDATGGAIDTPSPLRMVRSTVSRNEITASAPGGHASTALGGGIAFSDMGFYSSTMVNSTLASNSARALAPNTGSASARGGGINANVKSLILTNSTVARNVVGGSSVRTGGGINWDSGTVKLRSSIVALNKVPVPSDGPNCHGTLSSGGHNLLGTTKGCTFTSVTSDKLNKNPQLGPLSNNGGPTQTLALSSGSPAIDAIPKADCLVQVDQRGVMRPQHRRCDIGAFERKA